MFINGEVTIRLRRCFLLVFKTLSLLQAPDEDPEKHKVTLKTSTAETTVIIVRLGDIDKAVAIAKDMVEKEGIQSISLCLF